MEIFKKSDTKFNYITVLSVISAISVIILHTNGCFWEFSTERYWISANIIESVFYFAVPIFFMITGATLLDYNLKYSEREYSKKRIIKTVIPFLVWSIIGLIFSIIVTKSIKVEDLSFKYIFNAIFNTEIITIFWFFRDLFLIYLIIPILANIQQEKKVKLYLDFIILLLAFNVIFPFINNVFNLGLNFPIYINLACNSILLVLIGYVLDKKELKYSTRIIIYVLGIIGLLAHILMTQKLSFDAGKIVSTYKGYTNIPCIAYSVAIFVFFKQICDKLKFKKVFSFLSQYTFAFYLMQHFIYTTIQIIFKFNTHSIIYRLGMPFVVVVITIAITWVLRNIPIIKRIVP